MVRRRMKPRASSCSGSHWRTVASRPFRLSPLYSGPVTAQVTRSEGYRMLAVMSYAATLLSFMCGTMTRFTSGIAALARARDLEQLARNVVGHNVSAMSIEFDSIEVPKGRRRNERLLLCL